MVKRIQTLEEFYKNKLNDHSEALINYTGTFNVFRIEDNIRSGVASPTHIRRDFFKIMLFQGNNVFHYVNKSIEITGNTLLFFSPQLPYTYDPLTEGTTGYFCVFKSEFFEDIHRLNLNGLPLFAAGAQPVFQLNERENKLIQATFEKMITEVQTNYRYKYELIKSYLTELIYLAIKLQPSDIPVRNTDAATRITSLFVELLERQFPIESTAQRFQFRSPKSFADRLSVHVNYLNRAIKKTTGRTTTDHIFERLAAEAKALLKHTDLNISEISYILGFEDQAHFNNFFKKATNSSPSAFRQV